MLNIYCIDSQTKVYSCIKYTVCSIQQRWEILVQGYVWTLTHQGTYGITNFPHKNLQIYFQQLTKKLEWKKYKALQCSNSQCFNMICEKDKKYSYIETLLDNMILTICFNILKIKNLNLTHMATQCKLFSATILDIRVASGT